MGYLGKSMQDITQSFGRTLEIVKRPRKWFRVPSEIKISIVTFKRVALILQMVSKYYLEGG